MAAPRMIHRDRHGRFRAAPPPPIDPPRIGPDPVNAPTLSHPRFRLRVFHRAWPWRASYGEVLDDALASGNAISEYGRTYLTVPADVQQDPPGLPWGATVEDYARLRQAGRR